MAFYINIGRTRINEEAVQSYIRTGGEVSELLSGISRDVNMFGRAYISGKGHVRSGRLLKGMWGNKAKLEGPLQGVAQAGNGARHALYFHEGTSTIVAEGMIIPRNRRAAHTNIAFAGAGSQIYHENADKYLKQVTRMDTVSGQSSKPFLELGLTDSLKKRGLL